MSAEVLQYKQLWQLSGYATAASWFICVWDWLIRFDDEVNFIWPIARTAYIKWLYFSGRYFTLAVQTVVFAIQAYLVNHPMSLQNCRMYRGLEMAAATFLMLCFDVVLLLRIYALYGRRTRSAIFATFAVLAEFITTVVSSALGISATTYDSACIMIQIPRSILVFVAGTFISQAILLWLTYRKRERVIRSRSSLVCVTIRDGIMVFLCIAVFLLILFIFVLHNSPVTTLMTFFLPVFVSIGTCHLILNLQRVPCGESTQQFTTEVFGMERNADSFLLSNLDLTL